MAVDDVGGDDGRPAAPALPDLAQVVEIVVQAPGRPRVRHEALHAQVAVEPYIGRDIRARFERAEAIEWPRQQRRQFLRRHGADDDVRVQPFPAGQYDTLRTRLAQDGCDGSARAHAAARILDDLRRLRGVKIAQADHAETEMQAAVAGQLRVDAQQRRGRAAFQRHVRHDHRREPPPPVDHPLAHALVAQEVQHRHAVQRVDLFLAERHAAQGDAAHRQVIRQCEAGCRQQRRHEAEWRRQRPVAQPDGARPARDGEHLARLPADQATGAQPLQEREHVVVFGVKDVRADVDGVTRDGLDPAGRAPAQARRALQHGHAQATVGQRHRARQARQAAADHHRFLHLRPSIVRSAM
ncbi:conserved hypothetical protein, partial [Ricinus communis]